MGTRIIGGKLPSIAYQTTAVINATASSFTFAAQAIGTASGRRRVIVGVAHSGSTITGVTVGGITATLLSSFVPSLYIASVPTGTTANIVVTQSVSTASTVTITVWSVYDLRSATAVDIGTSTASPAVLDLDVSPRGIVVALAASGSSGASYTWTGITSDYSQTSGVNNIPRSGSHVVATTGSAPRTVRCTYSASSSPRAVAVSLR